MTSPLLISNLFWLRDCWYTYSFENLDIDENIGASQRKDLLSNFVVNTAQYSVYSAMSVTATHAVY